MRFKVARPSFEANGYTMCIARHLGIGVVLNREMTSVLGSNCFGNSLAESVDVEFPDCLDALLRLFEENRESYSVWRGQASLLWVPFPTLIRRLRQFGFADSQINEAVLQQAERRIVEDARRQRLIEGDNEILEFMGRLQHYGGSTRLLDVTHDPLIAAFFASGGHEDETGVIFRYRINPDNVIRIEDNDATWKDILNLKEPGRPVLVEPQIWDKRMEAQKAAFVTLSLPSELSVPNFYTNATYDSEVKVIWISPVLKRALREYLQGLGIVEESLFPSIEMFAKSHSTASPLPRLFP